MSAEIETMFYSERTPWHELGTYVGENPITAKEAIVEAGLDWEVTLNKIATVQNLDPGLDLYRDTNLIKNYKAVTRIPDNKTLGIVGNRYLPIQNKEAFSFLDSLVEDNSLRFHTAGSLKGGKKIWLLGKIGSFEVVPNDKVDQYLFLFNSHDGWGSLRTLFTPIRVVCANTAQLVLEQNRGQGVTIRHTGDLQKKKLEAQNILGIAKIAYARYEEFTSYLVNLQIDSIKLNNILNQIIPDPKEENKTSRILNSRVNKRNEIINLFENGIGQDIPGVQGTGWALYNAITEHLNYHQNTRGNLNIQERRFEKLILAPQKQFKNIEKILLAA